MPRPQKAGLDYFPLDTDMEKDDKIALIETKYGIVGFGIVIKLFKKSIIAKVITVIRMRKYNYSFLKNRS